MQQKTFKLELIEQHVLIIGAALGQCPYRDVAPVINAINAQIVDQQKDEAAGAAPSGGSD